MYASKHGYELLSGNNMIDSTRATAWSKLLAMEYYLKAEYDAIVFIDMDIVIMNMEIALESLIEASGDRDMVLTEDWSGTRVVYYPIWVSRPAMCICVFSINLWPFLTTLWSRLRLQVLILEYG